MFCPPPLPNTPKVQESPFKFVSTLTEAGRCLALIIFISFRGVGGRGRHHFRRRRRPLRPSSVAEPFPFRTLQFVGSTHKRVDLPFSYPLSPPTIQAAAKSGDIPARNRHCGGRPHPSAVTRQPRTEQALWWLVADSAVRGSHVRRPGMVHGVHGRSA